MISDIPVSLASAAIYSAIPAGYALPVSLATNIRKIRRSIDGLTQESLGAALGVGQGAVSKWEAGKSDPNVHDLPKIARHLGVSLDRLLQGVDAQYDAGRDLLGQGQRVQRESPPRQGEPDVPATARAEIERLRKERDAYKAQVEEMRDAAGRLATIAAVGQVHPARKHRAKVRRSG